MCFLQYDDESDAEPPQDERVRNKGPRGRTEAANIRKASWWKKKRTRITSSTGGDSISTALDAPTVHYQLRSSKNKRQIVDDNQRAITALVRAYPFMAPKTVKRYVQDVVAEFNEIMSELKAREPVAAPSLRATKPDAKTTQAAKPQACSNILRKPGYF